MKTSLMLAFTALISSGVLAQQVTNAPPPASAVPAPVSALDAPAQPKTPGPAKKKSPAKKKPAATPAAVAKKSTEPAVPLRPGPATVTTDNLNVRGQAKLTSERVVQLNAGDTVTVLEEIILDKPAADEPARWARIALPAATKVWVNTLFIDATNKTVLARRLNLRSGPGENFSIVGLVEKGEQLQEVGAVQGDWMQIEAPKTAYAFVASQYLKQEPLAAMLAAVPPPATPTSTPVLEAQPVVPEPVTPAPPAAEPVMADSPIAHAEFQDLPILAAPQPDSQPISKAREALRRKMAEMAAARIPTDSTAKEEPPPPRVVAHEGVVRSTWSIQSPTRFALVNPDTGRTINYLYTTSTNLDLGNYKGLRIVVTGEEGLDDRWKTTPVLTIQRIQVIE